MFESVNRTIDKVAIESTINVVGVINGDDLNVKDTSTETGAKTIRIFGKVDSAFAAGETVQFKLQETNQDPPTGYTDVSVTDLDLPHDLTSIPLLDGDVLAGAQSISVGYLGVCAFIRVVATGTGTPAGNVSADAIYETLNDAPDGGV